MSTYNNEIIAKALREALIADINEYEKIPDHKFSRHFKLKMKRLIARPFPITNDASERHIPSRKRIAIALIAVLLSLFLMGAALVAYKLWNYYHVEDYRLYSILNIDGNSDFPTELEERYMIGADMGEFTENVLTDEYFNYWVEYKSPDGIITINFEQYVKEAVQGMLLNTENAVDKPAETEVNGHRGVFFQTRYGNIVLIWDVGDYIIKLSATGIGKNKLFSIAESVQKVE